MASINNPLFRNDSAAGSVPAYDEHLTNKVQDSARVVPQPVDGGSNNGPPQPYPRLGQHPSSNGTLATPGK